MGWRPIQMVLIETYNNYKAQYKKHVEVATATKKLEKLAPKEQI